jgi:thiamine pyrophosphokinase
MRCALVFANGDVRDGPMVRRALSESGSPLVVAVDGGARMARHYQLDIDTVIGDMDSISALLLEQLMAAGVHIERHPPEKDFTDLELGLKYVAAQDCDWIRIIGGIGDRFDQTLANIYLLALPELAGRDVRVVAGKQEITLLRPGEHCLAGKAGDTVSLLPVGGPVQAISTRHMRYKLDGESLAFGPARGISNVMETDEAGITTGDGLLLVVHTVGRA